jgi:hypothetical protein
MLTYVIFSMESTAIFLPETITNIINILVMKKTHLLLFFVCLTTLVSAQLSKTVEISAGGLNAALTANEKATVTELIVTGSMNSNDFSQIRYNMPIIERIDISGVSIANQTIPTSSFDGKSTLIEAILPNDIKIIDSYSFHNCFNLEYVTLPDSLKQINYAAFHKCYKLAGDLVIPEKVWFIDSYAFYECKSLTSLTLSDSLKEIRHYTFRLCDSLTGQLEIPAKVTTLGSQTFDGTNYTSAKMLSLTPPSVHTGSSFSMGGIGIFFVKPEAKAAYRENVQWSPYIIIGGNEMVSVTVSIETPGTLGESVLQQVEYLKDVNNLTVNGNLNETDIALLRNNFPDLIHLDISNTSITQIPSNHFQNRTFLRSAVLPLNLQSMGQYAFYRCRNLQEIIIPDQVKTIDNYTFHECDRLHTVTLPPTLERILTYAFGYNYALNNVQLPDSLHTLGDYAFNKNLSLEKISIPPKITTINYAAFSECYKLKKVELPEGLTRIRNYAFQYCPIDTLVFPTTLQTIEGYAFQYNYALNHIVCQQPTPPVLPTDPFNQVQKTICTLEVPFWSMNMYKQALIWSNFATVIPFNKELKEIPISGPLTLLNNVRPTGFPNISILSNGSLIVGGNTPFPTDRFLIEGKYNSSSWGSLINDCPAMSANAVNVKLEFNSNKWYFLNFPFDVKVADITSNNNALFSIRKYDGLLRAQNGTGGSWIRMTPDSTLRAGNGYIINANANTTLQFRATNETRNQLFDPEEKQVQLNTYLSENTSNQSWNFIGNAYPSFYDTRYLDFTAPITVWNLSNNTYTAISLIDDTYALKPFEGFFAQKPNDLDAMIFLKGGRQNTATLSPVGPAGAPHRAPAATNRLRINLELTDHHLTDKTRIVFNPEASVRYEIERDASKFFSSEPTVPQLYSIDEHGTSYAINERPGADGRVKLGFYAGKSGSYKLSLGENSTDALTVITLEDTYQSTSTDLLLSDYSFTAESGTWNDRFILKIKDISTHTTFTNKSFHLSTAPGIIRIHCEAGVGFKVYTLNGILLHSIQSKGNIEELQVSAGVYIIKTDNETRKTVVF